MLSEHIHTFRVVIFFPPWTLLSRRCCPGEGLEYMPAVITLSE